MIVTLIPEVETLVQREAVRQGLSLDEYANRVLRQQASAAEQERREQAIALLQSWIDDGDEEEQKETGDYLIRVLDEDRLSDRKLFPEEMKGISW